MPNTTVWAPTQGVAAEEMVGSRTTAEADPPWRWASANLGQGAGAWPAQGRLAHDRMARRAPPSGYLRALHVCGFVSRIVITSSPTIDGKKSLLIEWPEGENEPTKYCLSTLPQDIAFRSLVDLTKLRWRIERIYQELKQEVGLGHFEGRGWRDFHHHRHAVHRGLRIPDLREGDDSPLSTPSRRVVPAICATPWLPTQGLRPCVPNGTSQTRSQPYAGD